jgi:hypothetical protein
MPKAAGGKEVDGTDVVSMKKAVLAVLNKLCPQNFDKLVEKFSRAADRLRGARDSREGRGSQKDPDRGEARLARSSASSLV